MDCNFKRVCPVCFGTLIYSRRVPPENPLESPDWVLLETDCECTETDCPGYIITGHIDLAGLDAKLDDIIAEQALQREDLTAALTTIINKLNE